MGAYLSSWFSRKPPQTPIKGFVPRIINLVSCHYRGLLGVIVPVVFFILMAERNNHTKWTQLMWMWMFWSFLIQPVAIPVTSMIPIFYLPMTGTLKTVEVCSCFFNESIGLLVLSGMLILLLNNSGADRRFSLWIMCLGDNNQFSAYRLVFKSATASFFLSMFSNRLIACSVITQYVSPALMEMNSAKGKGDPNFIEMRYIVNNVIHTSSAIGSTAVIHSSFATLLFRAVFTECTDKSMVQQDVFNYLQFSCFAFPVAFVQFLLNMGYHMLLIKFIVKTPMSAAKMGNMKNHLLKPKSSLPKKVTLHEKLTVFFAFFSLFIFFFRWTPWFEYGWASFNHVKSGEVALPTVLDATVAAIFVVFLHIFPKGFSFTKYVTAKKKSQLPPLKPESAVLWWKFIDKNLNYGYIFVFGGAIALCIAVRRLDLGPIVKANVGSYFTAHSWTMDVLLVCAVASILANCMSGVAMVTIFLPVIIHMLDVKSETAAPAEGLRLGDLDTGLLLRRLMAQGEDGGGGGAAADGSPWSAKLYLGALAVGLCGSYGFMSPFAYTPSYVAKNAGKVPMKKIALYSIFSVIICIVILWAGIVFWAPMIWGATGFVPVAAPTTAAPPQAGAPPAI